MDKLWLVIPAYNEEENIADVIDAWYPVVEKIGPDSRLVVIDDGSKDGTFAAVRACSEQRPQLVPLTKPNGGHGDAVLFAYNYAVNALEDDPDAYVFQTDSDGQTLAEEFKAFWDARRDFDLVIGHRKGRKDGFSRVVVTKVLKLVVRLCFGVTATDANTPFRLMKAKTLAENLKFVPAHFFLANVLLTVIYTRKKQRIKYIPITFRPRQGGVNSINLRKIFFLGIRALREFRAVNRSFRQL